MEAVCVIFHVVTTRSIVQNLYAIMSLSLDT